MSETFYKYDLGFKKDIGSQEVTKTFNDSFHFVNWWRKVTKEGKDDHFFGFRDADGNKINVDKIKRFDSDEMASDRLVGSAKVAEFGRRVNKAHEAGGHISARIQQDKEQASQDSSPFEETRGAWKRFWIRKKRLR